MKDAYEVAEILEEIYGRTFEDKDYGRFKISKTLFKKLCERRHLREGFMNSVIEEALELGLVVIPLEHDIVVIKESFILNCRAVPEDIIAEYEDDEDEDWDDEDEELEDIDDDFDDDNDEGE